MRLYLYVVHMMILFQLFLLGRVWVCELWESKSTNLYMYIDDLIHFIHVCQEFDKETYFGTTRVCQRIKSHGSSENSSENFSTRTVHRWERDTHTRLADLNAVMSCHFSKFIKTWFITILHCLASTQSLCLKSLKSSAVLPTVLYVLYVWVYILYISIDTHVHLPGVH